MYATASAKKEWFAQAFPERAQQAEQHLAAFDRRRAAVIRKFYQQEWCSRGLYHMLLNSCVGTEAMIDAVQCAAGLCAAATVRGSLRNLWRDNLTARIRNPLKRRARNARADARENLPGNGARGASVIVGGDGFIALRANEHDLVAGNDAGNVRYIHNCLVHADAAHQGARWPRTSRWKRLPRERSRPSA